MFLTLGYILATVINAERCAMSATQFRRPQEHVRSELFKALQEKFPKQNMTTSWGLHRSKGKVAATLTRRPSSSFVSIPVFNFAPVSLPTYRGPCQLGLSFSHEGGNGQTVTLRITKERQIVPC